MANLQVLCSYDGPNGIPSCANKAMQVDVLQKQYGLAGPIVTDCGAIPGMMCSLNFSATPEQAVADALHAGVAIDCGPYGGPCDNGHGVQQGGNASFGLPSTMHKAVAQGLITIDEVNDAFKTAYRTLFRAGLFDPPAQVPWTSIGLSSYGSEQHRRLAYELALQSMVLLENHPLSGVGELTGTEFEPPAMMLPLRSGLKLAVLGPQVGPVPCIRTTRLCSCAARTAL